MKTIIKNSDLQDNTITIFRYKVEELEQRIISEHELIKKDVAITLGKDLGAMVPPKPEPESQSDIYSGTISGAYNTMATKVRKELQSEIEAIHLIADKEEANRQIDDLDNVLELKQNEARLKKRELDDCDTTLLKKERRYARTRWFLIGIILIDLFISGAAFQSAGYSLIISYLIGGALGIGIFFLSENIRFIIEKGRNKLQKWLITGLVFSGLYIIFYVLGIFRSISFEGNEAFTQAVGPEYFAALNMFFTITTSLVSYFNGLTKEERLIIDHYRIVKEELSLLEQEIQKLKLEIQTIRKRQASSEIARKQIQLYSKDIYQLIQRLYEESLKTFYSTNVICRSDGKTPKFFKNEIPRLASLENLLNQ